MTSATILKKPLLALGLFLGTSFSFPSLVEDAPYCIYWKHRQIELPLRKGGNIHLIDGKNVVLQFGTWSDASKIEYEAHYLVEIDPSKRMFFGDTSGKEYQAVYHSVLSYGGSGGNELPRVKIKGIKISDSTWIINEWFSSQYNKMFGEMPYKLRKKDRRQKEGYKWTCKEILSP
jgi:hypothetical protein